MYHKHTCGASVKPTTSAGRTVVVVATSSAHAHALLRLVFGAEADGVVTEHLSCAGHIGAFDAILLLFPGPLSPYFVRVSVRRVSGTPSIFLKLLYYRQHCNRQLLYRSSSADVQNYSLVQGGVRLSLIHI